METKQPTAMYALAPQQEQQEQQQQHKPPSPPEMSSAKLIVIQDLRKLFALLNDDEFESECEIERLRRRRCQKNKNKKPSESNRNSVDCSSNSKRAPGAPDDDDDDDDSDKFSNGVDLDKKKRAIVTDGGVSSRKKTKVNTTASTRTTSNTAATNPPRADSTNRPRPQGSPLQPTVGAPAAAAAAKAPNDATASTSDSDDDRGHVDDHEADENDALPIEQDPKFLNSYQAKWNVKFNELREFKRQFGHLNVNSIVKKDDTSKALYEPLLNWVGEQRRQWHRALRAAHHSTGQGEEELETGKSRLSQDQINRLVEIGFGTHQEGPINYKVVTSKSLFEERFEELLEFRKQYGHVDVSDYKHRNHYQLAKWAEYQRVAFWRRQQQASSNNKEDIKDSKRREEQQQMARLTAIGFRWTSKHTTFESRFKDLSRYKELHGNTKVPIAYRELNNLGLWCANIKKQYHAKKMRPERVAMLESLGFDWGKYRGPNSATKKSSKSSTA